MLSLCFTVLRHKLRDYQDSVQFWLRLMGKLEVMGQGKSHRDDILRGIRQKNDDSMSTFCQQQFSTSSTVKLSTKARLSLGHNLFGKCRFWGFIHYFIYSIAFVSLICINLSIWVMGFWKMIEKLLWREDVSMFIKWRTIDCNGDH